MWSVQNRHLPRREDDRGHEWNDGRYVAYRAPGSCRARAWRRGAGEVSQIRLKMSIRIYSRTIPLAVDCANEGGHSCGVGDGVPR